MPLAAGTKLGPFEITAPIGAGGMGEVYRATDTRLDRTVAIKVLSEHLADRADLRERFEREAKAVSSLNHPHICTLHDIGEQDGIHYLVMEYVDGETLQQRLEKGRLPLDQALEYAIQIADALDKAHRQGVVHRDLKPGNIMITKAGTKLLDFGLAKLKVRPASTPASQWSTVDAQDKLTEEHTILGTPPYMSPEQLGGEDSGVGTDIWAFGVVLFEMATGQRPFQGESLSALMAGILNSAPPTVSEFEPNSPPALDRIVDTSLRKDPDDRWQTAHDLMLQLKWIIPEAGAEVGLSTSFRTKARERIAWTLAAIATVFFLIASATATRYFRDAGLSPPMGRFLVSSPTTPFGVNKATLTISPDGRHLAYLAPAQAGDVTDMLWILPLDSTASPRSLPGTEFASDPFWSPDSQSIGFFSFDPGPTLKTVDIEGGPPQVLLTRLASRRVRGGTWNTEGVIVFSMNGRLYRVFAGSDESTALPLDESPPEISERFPHFLPDGDHLLYSGWSDRAEDRAIYVRSLESPGKSRLLAVESQVVYAPSGHLLFHREGTLLAQPFDVERLEVAPEPVLIAEDVSFYNGRSAFSVSQNGVLVYNSGPIFDSQRFVWFDRGGNQLGAVGKAGQYIFSVELSPNAEELAVPVDGRIEVLRFDTNLMSPLTFELGVAMAPVWSGDGEWIAFASKSGGDILDLYRKRSNGAGVEQLLLGGRGDKYPTDFSADGGLVFFWETGENYLEHHSWILPPRGGDPVPLANVGYHAKLSPNGKWIAYTAYTNPAGVGTTGVFVRAVGLDGGMWQIADGGTFPRWRGDGKELFYVTQADSELVAVEVTTDGIFEHGVQRSLFQTPIQTEALFPGFHQNYDVTPDGERFILPVPASSGPITVITNWTSLLEANQ